VTDRKAYDPTRTAVHLLVTIRTLYHDRFAWIPAHFDRLAGTSALRSAIDMRMDPERIVDRWQLEREAFVNRRRPFLLYPE
jgi:uncharacterized protein YbbC (DUF1343 family)